MMPDIVEDHVAVEDGKDKSKGRMNLKVMAVDLDTTGRRLCDKIFQLAVFSPFGRYEQYMMPAINLNSAARLRHQVRVTRLKGRRVLKTMLTNKIIKTESEQSGFRKFIDWLQEQSAHTSGIVIVYHEERKFIPLMILQSVIKFNLLKEFGKMVIGFVNTNEIAKSMLSGKARSYLSVRGLLAVLAREKGEEIYTKEFTGSASVRAKLVFNVAAELCDREPNISHLFAALKPHLETIDSLILELDQGYATLKRQNSFRPLFVNYFKTTVQRVRAVKFRIALAENGLDLTILSDIWKDLRIQGLITTLEPIGRLTDSEKTELVAVLDSYFDPNKIAIKPKPREQTSSRRRRAHNNSIASPVAAAADADADADNQLDEVPPSPYTSTPKGQAPNAENNNNQINTNNDNDTNNENTIDSNTDNDENPQRRTPRRIMLSPDKVSQDGAVAIGPPLQENNQISSPN
ncbi:maternal protein exuperantia [Drosophila mojavensis]|uniref:Uncharacterized protein n=1 Tax=Drosophila mojavensis TaxID=7230 RepID=B4LA16_DROMO|nr:maternal protein exuperantia [Drosophila mojavensis]EDW08078.2 uncharacterized protein Dmoj_GI10874 [Drosophila mojavensis]